jgi:hypothetical protein
MSKQLARIVALAAVAALAIVAFASASASAATWTVEGKTLTEGTANGLAVNATLKKESTAVLKGEVLGQEFLLTSTKLTSLNGLIYQELPGVAKDEGVLEFSELTLDKPAGCKVKGGVVKTKQLTSELVPHPKGEGEEGNNRGYDKFFPEEGEVFTTITLEGCAAAGPYNVKGVVYGQGEAWGTEKAEQPLTFSPTVNSTLGGSLTLGVKPATLTAEGVNHLAVKTEEGNLKTFGADK